MLSDELKHTIQGYYSELLKNKDLRARHGQKLMIAEIARSFAAVETDEEGRRSSPEPAVCVIEAGTGTGKTIAYLVPAIPVAQALGKKLVIATATVALQEQVMFKDLPDLQRHSGMRFSFALAKGRGRYLCLSKLDNQLRANGSQEAMLDLFGIALDGAETAQPDRELYQKMLDRLSEGAWKGDRDDWPEALDEGQWRNVSVEHGQCSGSRCSYFSNCCFFRSRESLQKADCIVANHDLVLADLSLGGGAILPPPEDSIYIFDEAHHLPLKGINHFSHFLRLRAGARSLEQMGGAFTRLQAESSSGGELRQTLEEAAAAAAEAKEGMNQAFLLFEQFGERAEAGNGRADQRQFVFEGGVVEPALREACRDLCIQFGELARLLDKILDTVKQCMEVEGGELERPRAETWFPLIGTLHTRAQAAAGLWHHFGAEDSGSAPFARWLGFADHNGESEISLSCSPVIAAEALGSTLWSEAFAVLMTSATLCALDSFDFLGLRAGLPAGTRYSRIASPFDYTNKVLLRVPSRGFDPGNAQAHTEAIVSILPKIVERRAGTLVLFSSRRQMQEVLAALDAGLLALVSSQDDFTKQQLLARHKERIDKGEGSVLFGLASLTEGIDLPGAYCTHVIIAKIPFAVPNDPVEATLAWWVESQGRNAFQEISVPEAATRLVQACGRLVRTEEDGGTITILDERLVTRRYGQSILDALPPYRREIFQTGPR